MMDTAGEPSDKLAATETLVGERLVEGLSRQQDWVSAQQMKQLVRICCLEVMGAAPAQLEHYRQEVNELQLLVADFRREVAELKELKIGGSPTSEELNLVDPPNSLFPGGAEFQNTTGDDAGCGGRCTGGISPMPQAARLILALSARGARPPSSALSPTGEAGVNMLERRADFDAEPTSYYPVAELSSLRRVYIELDGAPIQSWYENRPMPPITVKLVNDQSPASLVTNLSDMRLRISLCNGRGLPEERTANGAQALLMGEREVRVQHGYATFQNLRVMEISQKHYGSFQLAISAVCIEEGVSIQPLRSKQFGVQVGRMWSKRRKSEDEILPDDPISQIPGVGNQYVSRLHENGVTQIRQFAALCATEEGKAMLQRMFKGGKVKSSLNDAKFKQMIEQANKVMQHGNLGNSGANGDGDGENEEFDGYGYDEAGEAKRACTLDHKEGLYAMHPGTPVSDETDGRTGSESPVPRFGATEYVSGSVTPLGLSVANPHSLLVNPLNSSAEGTLQQVSALPPSAKAMAIPSDQFSMDEIMILFAEDVPQHELVWRSAGTPLAGAGAVYRDARVNAAPLSVDTVPGGRDASKPPGATA
mmetsp:Transcript_4098/g.10610  ORF Transcript_4098/g.10610 Transcript_4098/m.10610 type:complete len:592 (+) Transcript_4098:24-1799(+)